MANNRSKQGSKLLPNNPLFQTSETEQEMALPSFSELGVSNSEQDNTDQSPEVVVVVDSPLSAPVGIRAEVSPANITRLEGFQTKHGISRSEALDLLLEMIDEISPTKIYDLKEAALLRQLAELKAKYQG